VVIGEMGASPCEIVVVPDAAVFEDMVCQMPDVSKIQGIGYESGLDVEKERGRIIAQQPALARHAEYRA
jgi:hypothetical protein